MTRPERTPAGTPTGGQFATSTKAEAVVDLASGYVQSDWEKRRDSVQPTPDQTYCDFDMHQQCSGYTEDESDPESCFCTCHDQDFR